MLVWTQCSMLIATSIEHSPRLDMTCQCSCLCVCGSLIVPEHPGARICSCGNLVSNTCTGGSSARSLPTSRAKRATCATQTADFGAYEIGVWRPIPARHCDLHSASLAALWWPVPALFPPSVARGISGAPGLSHLLLASFRGLHGFSKHRFVPPTVSTVCTEMNGGLRRTCTAVT